MRRGEIVALLLLIPTAGSSGAESFSWHALEAPVFATQRFELIAHSRVRTRSHFSKFDDVRAGPVVKFHPFAHVSLLGGYYFQNGDPLDPVPTHTNRLFTGVEIPWSWNARTMTSRSVVERYIGGIRSDYTRYRTSLRITWQQRRLSPYLQSEALFVRDGFHSSRTSAGIILRPERHVRMEIGYLFDVRRAFWGGNRHALVTNVRFQRAER